MSDYFFIMLFLLTRTSLVHHVMQGSAGLTHIRHIFSSSPILLAHPSQGSSEYGNGPIVCRRPFTFSKNYTSKVSWPIFIILWKASSGRVNACRRFLDWFDGNSGSRHKGSINFWWERLKKNRLWNHEADSLYICYVAMLSKFHYDHVPSTAHLSITCTRWAFVIIECFIVHKQLIKTEFHLTSGMVLGW